MSEVVLVLGVSIVVGPLGRALVPSQNPQCAKSVPPTGPTVAILERKVDLAGMCIFK